MDNEAIMSRRKFLALMGVKVAGGVAATAGAADFAFGVIPEKNENHEAAHRKFPQSDKTTRAEFDRLNRSNVDRAKRDAIVAGIGAAVALFTPTPRRGKKTA